MDIAQDRRHVTRCLPQGFVACDTVLARPIPAQVSKHAHHLFHKAAKPMPGAYRQLQPERPSAIMHKTNAR